MKKNYLFTLVCLVMIVFYSCQKETPEDPKNTRSLVEERSELNIAVEVKNNMLVFKNREAYDQAIEALGPLQNADFDAWEKSIGFYSMRQALSDEELLKKGIEDPFLAVFLNPEARIEIGGNVFEIDLIKQQVAVLNTTEFLSAKNIVDSKKVRLYSTKEDVLDLIENSLKSSETITKKLYCDREKKDKNFYYGVGPSDTYIRSKVVYQKAGILFSLVANLKKQYFDFVPHIRLKTTDNAPNKWVNNGGSGNIAPFNEGSFTERELDYRPYHRTRRLKSFHFSMECRIDGSENGNFGGRSYFLKINCS
jgi:hypothetical protein